MIDERERPRILLERRSANDGRLLAAYELPLSPVVRFALGDRVPSDRDVDILLRFRPRPDTAEVPEDARMVNRHADETGWVDVSVRLDDETVYEASHTVRGLLGEALLGIADALDEGRSWGFHVVYPERGDQPLLFRSPGVRKGERRSFDIHQFPTEEPRRRVALLIGVARRGRLVAERTPVRPTPDVEGSVVVDLKERHVPFTIRKAAEPDLPQRDAAAEGLDPDLLTRVNVALPAGLYEQLTRGMELSGRVEEGGFVAGEVLGLGEDRHLLVVHRVLTAEHTGASKVHFTFTSDSFQVMHRALKPDDPADRLLGWWHTHPSGVGVRMGLSETDVELHHSTFRKSWQVAGLINLGVRRGAERARLVRFYAADDDQGMERCALWIHDERHGYRLAPDAVDDRGD